MRPWLRWLLPVLMLNASVSGSTSAELKLDAARTALQAGQFDNAIDAIEASAAEFTEPRQQADALFIVAQATFGKLPKAASAEELKDAAIAFMRVVAFADETSPARVAASLLNTGRIHERLKEPETARRLYTSVVDEYPDQPEAAEARQALSELPAETSKAP